MTNDDIDAPEDFEKGPIEKPSLKEVWANNPMMKLAAIVLGGVITVGGYLIFFSDGADDAISVLRTGRIDNVKQTPGQQELDPVYRKALEDANKKAAQAAAQSGGSALPTPIGTSKTGGLELPQVPERPKSDVLAEWRKATGKSRIAAAQSAIEDDNGTPPPEVVPVVQPVRPQQVIKQDPEFANSLLAQMRVIVSAQAPIKLANATVTREPSLYVVQRTEREAQKAKEKQEEATGKLAAGGDGADKNSSQTIVPAGSVAYAQLMNELNSDIEGPVLAQVLSGPFAGGRAIGKLSVKDEYIVITFTRIVKDAVSYTMNGVALDEKTTLAGQATDVDHHYFMRVILPAAAKFVEGYGSSVAETGSTAVAAAGGGTVSSQPKPDAKENIYKGVEESSKALSEILKKDADRPITVKVAKGTTMGIFFVDTVTTKDTEK